MAKPDKNATATAPAPTNKGGVCLADGCGKSSARAEFCNEHFGWYKLGLITKTGSRAKDFDKKFMQYTRGRDSNA